MRVPIIVHVAPHDIEQDQPQIDAARQAFVRYLAELGRRPTRSKYGLMGPVGKILSEVKSGRRDAPSLKGYALRVQEATQKRRPSPAALEALAEGIDLLVKLLADAPITTHDRILDRLDYGLYYELRKQELESREARRQAWVEFLRKKYGNARGLAEAWGNPVEDFDEVYLPSKTEGSRLKKADVRQRDIAEFWESQGVAGIEEEEE
jgi:hypothetical protein